jgi:hypothetical protein
MKTSTYLGLNIPDSGSDVVTRANYQANFEIIDAATIAEVYNVNNFGAAGDGTTDDSAAIQAAIDAIPDTGGALYFPAGTYRLNTALVTKNYIKWQGAGAYSTILKPLDSANLAAVITQEDTSTGYVVGNVFRDFQIYGNVENGNSSVYGINIAAQQCIAENIFIQYCNFGIQFNSGWQGTAYYNTISHCAISLFDSVGIRIGSRSKVENCLISGCGMRDSSTRNWLTCGAINEGDNVVFQNNHFTYNYRIQLWVSWGWRTLVQGNLFTEAIGVDIMLYASVNYATITNNVFDDTSSWGEVAGTNFIEFSAISESNAKYCYIANNHFIPSSYNQRLNCIMEVDGCDYNQYIYNRTTGAYSNAGVVKVGTNSMVVTA